MKQSFVADSTARALLVLLFLVAVVASIFIAGASLHDPDTCWLLSLGMKIVEGGALPQADPYSYTMQLFPERRFILYQWLSEVLFALSYKALDLAGLLLLAAVVLTASFISVPLALARKIGMPGCFAIAGTILTLLTAFFHFLCRPEIFSYLLLGTYISMTHFFLRNRNVEKVDWKAVTVFGAIMAIWCNLHSGFVLGLLYLFVFALVTTISDFAAEKKLQAIDRTIIFSFVAALVGTFVNPYGIGLWQYLPTLFFTPLNRHIIELRPVSGKDFLEWTFYPFVILLVVTGITCARALMKKIDSSIVSTPRGQVLFAAIAVFSWIIAGFCCRRLIPFAAIHLFAEGGYMLALLRKQKVAGQPDAVQNNAAPTFWEMVDQKLQNSYHPHGLMWFVTIAVFAGVGVFFVSSRIPDAIVLPQSSKVMQAPFDAVKVIGEKPPAGRVFNDPQFGDVMIWKLQQPPKLFIDTRFDMYGARIVEDYQTIYSTKDGWEELLKKYQISWVFVRPEAPIAKRLAERGWKTLYVDKAAIVIHIPDAGSSTD
jgi:hypothetical protein